MRAESLQPFNRATPQGLATSTWLGGLAMGLLIVGFLKFGLFAVPVLAVSGVLLLSSRQLLRWQNLLIFFIANILLIPSNVYKLPAFLPFDLEIYRITALIIFVLWFVSLLVDSKTALRRTPFDYFLAAIVFSIFASLILNLNEFEPLQEFPEAIKAFLYFVTFILLFYFITSTIRETSEAMTILKVMVLLAGIISLAGIIERLTGANIFRHWHEVIPGLRFDAAALNGQFMRGGRRVAGSVSHPIAFSAILAMLVPLAFYFWQVAKNRIGRLFFGSITLSTAAATFLTGSRTGFLGLVLGFVVILIGTPKQRKTILASGFALLFVVHMVFPGALATLKHYLSPSYIEKSEVGNKYGRTEDYPRIVQEFSKKPAIGRGYGTFDPRLFFFVDNQYLKFLVELGAIGLFTIFLFFFQIIRRLKAAIPLAKSPDKSLLLAITASSLVFMFVTATFDTFGFSQVPYLFFTILALGTTILLNNEEAARTTEPS